MKKVLLLVVMAFSVNYLFAYDYFNQSVVIKSTDVVTGEDIIRIVSLKIGISDSYVYLRLDNDDTAEFITFYVDNDGVKLNNDGSLCFGTSYAHDYLTMKSAKNNTFRGKGAVNIGPLPIDNSKLNKYEQGTVGIVCIVFVHEQPETGQIYYIFFKDKSNPYDDILQAFIKASNAKKDSTNTSNNTIKQTDYVDLGLPSGTLWKSLNEDGLYTFDGAVKKFGNKLPTIHQIDELVNNCTWTFDNASKSMKATGPNGEYLLFPLDGFVSCQGIQYDKNNRGYYWSSKKYVQGYAQWLSISSDKYRMGRFVNQEICISQSVRLVK